MPRAIWKGSISFGLVSIPVELHTAVRDHRPKFRMLHARDKSPVRYERVCQRDGKPVAWEDLVKGDEIDDRYFETPYYLTPQKRGNVRKAELDMAKMLVENLAAAWDPAKYTDEYQAGKKKRSRHAA